MDFFDLIKHAVGPAGGAFESLPPNRWDPVSFTPDRNQPGAKVGTVTAHGVGFANGVAWAYWTYDSTHDNQTHTVWATSTSAGQASVSVADGEHDHANRGNEKSNPRIAIHPIVIPFPNHNRRVGF